MASEMALGYYRMKILIWEMLSEKKGRRYYVAAAFRHLADPSQVRRVKEIKTPY